MRILHISSARAPGGGERHLADLARGLVARGHEVYAALAPASPLHAELRRELPQANVFTLPLRNALDVESAVKLSRIVRERRIEIVHAHVGRDYPLAAYASRRTRGSRLVITRHVLFPLGRIHRLTLRHAARVVAVSEAVARALRAQRIFPPDKIRVVPNAVDFTRLDGAARDFNREEFRRGLGVGAASLLVGTVGELSRVKGQEDFVRAAATVARSFVGGVEFLIVGEDGSRTGDTRLRLERLIDGQGLRGRVHLTGRRDDIARVLHALDLFVSASRSEAFGLAIVEASACGVAVVATATEGAREIVGDDVNGKLVPVGDVEALAATVTELLRNPRERARLGAQARADARQRFDISRMIEATEQVYLEASGV